MLNKKDFEELAGKVKVDDFHVMMVSDGSGNLHNKPCGWWCGFYYKPLQKTKEYYGGCNAGSVNYAELSPFLHTLYVFHSALVKVNLLNSVDEWKILLISDSEVTVKCGNKEYQRKSNLPLWAQIDWYAQNGFDLNWKWVKRNTNPVSLKADTISKKIRKSMENI